MNKLIFVALVTGTLATGCTNADYGRPGYATGDNAYREYRRYDHNRPDPAYNGYYADRYYRDDPSYRERRLARNDRVYRGENGQYYCRRSDGTTGLIVGGIAGGILGNIIAPGGSKTLGTIIGGAGGAVAGSAIDKNGARCR